jgi:MFS family permease
MDRVRRLGAPAPIGRVPLALLLAATLAVATAYGVLLLLPLHLKQLGGSEATYGVLTAMAAVPAAAALAALLRVPDRVRPALVSAAASLVYAAATAALAALPAIGVLLAVLVVAMGSAWAVVYTVGPMVVSDHVPDGARAAYIGYVTGTVQLGFGIGPVLGGWLHDRAWSYPEIFVVGAGLAAGAAGLVALVAAVLPPAPRRSPAAPLCGAMVSVARSPALTPLVMILITACLFTTMNSFQTTFAQSRGLRFDVYYVTYTVAVIVARLVVAPFFRDTSVRPVVLGATLGIGVALVGFLFTGSSVARYGAASALLGAAYGLALPAIQARAVNLAPVADRARMLPLAGLVFQTVILAFPLVAGAVITAFGYQSVFVVLVGLAAALVALGLRHPGWRPAQMQDRAS